MAEKPYGAVVAVDIGTVCTKLSWIPTSTRSTRNAHLYDQWPMAKDKSQVPTAVLYRPVQKGKETEWKMHAFGQKAIDLHLKDDESAGFPLFRNFKMVLHSRKVS